MLQGNAQVAPAEAVHLLQGTLPVSAQTLPTVELENVDPALLLPTASAAGEYHCSSLNKLLICSTSLNMHTVACAACMAQLHLPCIARHASSVSS